MVGNNYLSEFETTRADAGIGYFLKGKENGEFKYIPDLQKRFYNNNNVHELFYVLNSDHRGKK